MPFELLLGPYMDKWLVCLLVSHRIYMAKSCLGGDKMGVDVVEYVSQSQI